METRRFMDTSSIKLPMGTSLLCNDVQLLGTTRGVLNRFRLTPRSPATASGALSALEEQDLK